MKPAPRIMLVIYCLLFTYCCVWIPWRVTTSWGSEPVRHLATVEYSLIWVAPGRDYGRHLVAAIPDIPLITLRILALTALAVGTFVALPRRFRVADLSARRNILDGLRKEVTALLQPRAPQPRDAGA